MDQYGSHFVVINSGVDKRENYIVTSLILQNLLVRCLVLMYFFKFHVQTSGLF